MKKRINITLDDDVIERVDSYARQHYTSRSGAITMLIVDATEINTKRKKNRNNSYEINDGIYDWEYSGADRE